MNMIEPIDRVRAARKGIEPLAFDSLPEHALATEPPEARGIERDDVRLMVSRWRSDSIAHARFHELPEFLAEGDLLLVNTSRTIPAALDARRADGTILAVHLSTRLPSGEWVVELRRPASVATLPFHEGVAGETLELPDDARVTIIRSYPETIEQRSEGTTSGPAQSGSKKGSRLWVARLDIPDDIDPYLARNGRPIRYGYVERDWPLSYYQTIFADESGSAEMPSAGRGFTDALVTRLVSRGVQIAPLLLHTGVASQESHEPPYPEYYRVSAATARRVNETRAAGGRVVAVGTTAVRAIESATRSSGLVGESSARTDIVISPERGVRAVDGIITGLHEPQATHLLMLAAIAPVGHLLAAYHQAIAQGYLWHEFGDMHLILP
jgi:S-adenosylmethionine:tRNA ribosyltransferase-isomerase